MRVRRRSSHGRTRRARQEGELIGAWVDPYSFSQCVIDPENRDQVLLLVPARVALAEKPEALAGVAGKRGIRRDAGLEFALDLGIRQHLARLLLGHVRLHVLFLLEYAVHE